ncbi:MAG: Lar family restriction alleviation protein [Candidatus Competibacteraceae bacterium]|nr:Lar family restriction alleviation protein [Candidatus Competibacteraceae bacterium]
MSDTVDLLDCPFCGCEAHIGQWRDTVKPNASWVECMNPDCMAATQTYYDPDMEAAKRKAVAAWNRRTQPQRNVKLVAAPSVSVLRGSA